MKKTALLILTTLALASCAQTSGQKNLVAQDLENHRFVLQSVNGSPYVAKDSGKVPELGFGEKMQIFGAMCNRFVGQGTLNGDQLKAEGLGMTRMMCDDPQLNALDNQLTQMLNNGARISFNGQQLTLERDQYTLVYTLARPQ
ncbi:META domain-containing protein [Citrobacter sp. JGM124]|uniref:META domain-containing protein n=1 Tax=Citrobacter sp. JGM124 TaxID=2799789 RepID=UPI001BAC606D|nr:META domain-containing protein [Citrobacter sp. JGM124]MBS0847411.1 META domain-containing protein [Citrobacter sp. JGM124]